MAWRLRRFQRHAEAADALPLLFALLLTLMPACIMPGEATRQEEPASPAVQAQGEDSAQPSAPAPAPVKVDTSTASGAQPTLPAWVSNLPLWQWYPIPSTALASVEPRPRPRGNSGPESKISAWCGAALKRQGSWYLLGAAGGHADYAGNEVNAIQLNTVQPKWVQLHPPSPDAVVIDAQYYLDRKPAATHTYYATQFINARNRMLIIAPGGLSLGVAPPPDWLYPQNAGYTYSFNLDNNQWDAPEYIARYTGVGDDTSALVVKHPITEDIYYSENYGGGWWRWTQASNTWKKLSDNSRNPWYAGSAIDPIRDRILIAGGYNPNTLPEVRDFNGDHLFARFRGLGESALALPAYSGVIYDEANDNFLTFHNASDNTIAVHRVSAKDWNVDRPAISGPAPAARPRGVHNAVQYVPELRGVVIANSYHGNVYFMRTAR